MEKPWQSLYKALAFEGKTMAVSMPGFIFSGENPGGLYARFIFCWKNTGSLYATLWLLVEKQRTWQSLCQF